MLNLTQLLAQRRSIASILDDLRIYFSFTVEKVNDCGSICRCRLYQVGGLGKVYRLHPSHVNGLNPMVSSINLSSTVSASIALLLSAGLLIASSGCSTLNMFSQPAVLPEEEPAPSKGMYQVEMSGSFHKSTVYQGEIDGPITVQTVLERSGAIDKFRGMDILIYRVVQETGQGLKMPVEYKYSQKMVSPEQDYAIHPNDRIVVSSRSNNALDRLVDSITPDQ